MVDMYSLLVMYGGTFDPVHYGHLKSVETLANLIDLRRLIIVPNNIPPHRQQPTANSTQRNHMLELAIFNNPLFVLDKRELRREIPSYTSQTLQEWRREVGITRPLAFIIGQDSLLSFPFWHQYKTILDNAHLIVCRRPGYPLAMKEKQHQRLVNAHLTDNPDDLRSLSAGKIYLAETPWFDISSTLIRQRLQNKLPCDSLLPASVLEYINQQELYQKHTE